MCAIPRDNTSKSTIKQKLSFTPVHTPVLSLLPRARAVRIDDLRLVAGVAHQQAAKGSAGRQQTASLHVAGVRCCLFFVFFERERKMLFVN